MSDKNNISDRLRDAIYKYNEREKRNELLNILIESIDNVDMKNLISLIKHRIDKANINITGFTDTDIEVWQTIFAKDFYRQLEQDDFKTSIDCRIEELRYDFMELENKLETFDYIFPEDRLPTKITMANIEMYRIYLENVLIQFNTEIKYEKLSIKKNSTYKWQWQGDAQTQLQKLFRKLHGNFIDIDTDKDLFISILSGKVEISDTPIKWIKSVRSLTHFLNECFKGSNWQTLTERNKYFINIDNKPLLKGDFSQAKIRMKKEGQPNECLEVDNILKEIRMVNSG
jgi:hypothetical protein